jgi:hypothetical protein
MHDRIHGRKVNNSEELIECEECLEFFFKKYGWEYYPDNLLSGNKLILFNEKKKEHMAILKLDVCLTFLFNFLV